LKKKIKLIKKGVLNMEDLVSQTSLICSGIVLVAILITIGLLRSLANIFIFIIFGSAILSPIGFDYYNNVSNLQIDKNLLYLYAFGIGIFATLLTIPLWGISSIMNFKDKSQATKIQKIQDNLKDLKNKSE